MSFAAGTTGSDLNGVKGAGKNLMAAMAPWPSQPPNNASHILTHLSPKLRNREELGIGTATKSKGLWQHVVVVP